MGFHNQNANFKLEPSDSITTHQYTLPSIRRGFIKTRAMQISRSSGSTDYLHNRVEPKSTYMMYQRPNLFSGALNLDYASHILIHLGDNTNKLSSQILETASHFSQIVSASCNSNDCVYFANLMPPEFLLPSELRSPNARKKSSPWLESNITVIASAILNAVLTNPAKSSVYAALVGVWHLHNTRLNDTVDFDPSNEGLQATPNIMTDRKHSNKEIIMRKTRWWVNHSLTFSVVGTVCEKIEKLIQEGNVTRSARALRFLCELANCAVVEFDSLLTSLDNLLTSLAESRNLATPYLEKIIEIVSSSIFWLVPSKSAAHQNLVKQFATKIKTCLANRDVRFEKTMLKHFSSISGSESFTNFFSNAVESFEHHGWIESTLLRAYAGSTIANIIKTHDGAIAHKIKLLQVDTTRLEQKLKCMNEKLYSQIHLPFVKSGFHSLSEEFQDTATIIDQELKYDPAFSRYTIFTTFSTSDVKDLLCGVKPLERHDIWLIRELVLSCLSEFRDSLDVCAEFILHLPVQHDQFELVLVDTVFNELLNSPNSKESPFFFTRLAECLCYKQESLIQIFALAIRSLVFQSPSWTYDSFKIMTDFVSYWLSVSVKHAEAIDFQAWSPHRFASTAYRNEWISQGHHFSETNSTKQEYSDLNNNYQLAGIPFHVDTFLRELVEKMSNLMWTEHISDRLPDWLHPFISKSSNVEFLKNKIKAACPDLALLEATFFESTILTRFGSDAHKNASVSKLRTTIVTKILNFPKLAVCPSEEFIQNVICQESSRLKAENARAEELISLDISSPRHSPVLAQKSIFNAETSLDDIHNLCASKIKQEMPETTGNQLLADEEADTVHEKQRFVKNENLSQNTANNEAASISNFILDEEFKYDETSGIWTLENLIKLILSIMLLKGAKSLTHTQRLLKNYKTLFIDLRPQGSDQIFYEFCFLEVVEIFWDSVPLRLRWMWENLVECQIISPCSLQSYILKKSAIATITHTSIFELILKLPMCPRSINSADGNFEEKNLLESADSDCMKKMKLSSDPDQMLTTKSKYTVHQSVIEAFAESLVERIYQLSLAQSHVKMLLLSFFAAYIRHFLYFFPFESIFFNNKSESQMESPIDTMMTEFKYLKQLIFHSVCLHDTSSNPVANHTLT